MGELASVAAHTIVIEIGGMPVLVRTDSTEFLRMLQGRYSGFVSLDARPFCEFDVELVPPAKITDEDDIAVRFNAGHWLIERGDLRVEWDPASGRGGGTAGCAQNFELLDTATGFPGAAVAGATESVGMSAIIIDNVSSSGQASSIYLGTLTGGANDAIKLTQSGLE
jgi:hypothetical protein